MTGDHFMHSYCCASVAILNSRSIDVPEEPNLHNVELVMASAQDDTHKSRWQQRKAWQKVGRSRDKQLIAELQSKILFLETKLDKQACSSISRLKAFYRHFKGLLQAF